MSQDAVPMTDSKLTLAGNGVERDISVERDGLALRGTLTLPVRRVHTGLETEAVPVVVMLNGVTANRKIYRFVALADELARRGIASMRFDLHGRGESDGDFTDMTVPGEVLDIRAIVDLARSMAGLDGKRIALLGHSQGGVSASLFAGQYPDDLAALVLMAPAAVLVDDARSGSCPIPGIGAEYARTASELDIYAIASGYRGPACIIHGDQDDIVPVSYAERYRAAWGQADLHILHDDNHALMRNPRLVQEIAASFLAKHLGVDDDERTSFIEMLRYLHREGVEPNPRIRAGMVRLGISWEDINDVVEF